MFHVKHWESDLSFLFHVKHSRSSRLKNVCPKTDGLVRRSLTVPAVPVLSNRGKIQCSTWNTASPRRNNSPRCYDKQLPRKCFTWNIFFRNMGKNQFRLHNGKRKKKRILGGVWRATWGFIGAVEKIGERSASLAQFAEAAFMTESEG